MFYLLSNVLYSQETRNSIIINKDIKTNNGIDIYDNFDYKNPHPGLTPNNNSKILVYINKKFYSSDTLSKIKNKEEYYSEIIKVPDSITKDIKAIIYFRKK